MVKYMLLLEYQIQICQKLADHFGYGLGWESPRASRREAEANRLFKVGRFRLSRQRCRADLGMA